MKIKYWFQNKGKVNTVQMINIVIYLYLCQGGKNRRRGKNENENEKRELIFKEEGQEYAQVTRMLGNGRLEAACFDGQKRLAHIRGKMRKKVWIAQGDIILLSLREFQDDKADVIQKYTPDEARSLKSYGELPNEAKINENEAFGEEDLEGEIEFGEGGEEDDDDEEEESDVDVDALQMIILSLIIVVLKEKFMCIYIS